MAELTLEDLQANGIFEGLTSSFFANCGSRPTAPPKTPLNDSSVRMYQIAQNILTPQRGEERQHLGAKIGHKSHVSFIDTAANNQTIVDNAEQMIEVMIEQDSVYFGTEAYGDFEYLENVQIANSRRKPQFLITRRPTSSMRSTSASFHRSSGPQKLQPAELLTQRDVMKGIDYISQVIFKESYSLETHFFACTLFHRVLSSLEIKKQEVKLLAALCVFEATKVEENYGEALGTSALVSYFSDMFTIQDVLSGELRMLDAIGWRLGISSLNTRSYLRCLIRDMGLPIEIALLASFLSEIILMTPAYLRFPFYEQAIGCIEVAILAIWNSPLELPMKSDDLQSTALLLAKGGSNVACNEFICAEWAEFIKDGQGTQTYEKYSEDAMFRIAKKVRVLPGYEKAYEAFVSQHMQTVEGGAGPIIEKR